jgi:hypothetical protein
MREASVTVHQQALLDTGELILNSGLGYESSSKKFVCFRNLPLRFRFDLAARSQSDFARFRSAADKRGLDKNQWNVCALSELLLCSGGAKGIDSFHPFDDLDSHRSNSLLCHFRSIGFSSEGVAVIWIY